MNALAVPLCICGHFHGATCQCGCTIYEPDDGGLDYDQGDDASCLGRGIYATGTPNEGTERDDD